MKLALCSLFVLSTLSVPALHAVDSPQAPPAEQHVRTELYFGSLQNGKPIDAKEWKNFLDTYITPAFPDGLTVVDAQGQWKNSKGVLITEPSKVVVLIYTPAKDKAASIKTIIGKYKALYGQESVLETTAPVAADFHLEKSDAPAQSSPLDDYAKFIHTPRENYPEGYIGFLKKTRFTKGELDNLPKCAVILFSSEVKEMLKAIGESDVTELELGSATSNRLYVVRRNGVPEYMVNLGLPGGGGIQTQVAELSALGAKFIVHVGTCAALSDTARDGALIVSSGSYKDGAATMLATETNSVSLPSKNLQAQLKETLTSAKTEFIEGLGFTMPIYYYQPSGLIKSLLGSADYGAGKPLYMEMEQAAFFETAHRAGVSAASLVVVSDRFAIVDGKLTHSFSESVKPALIKALEACRNTFKRLDEIKK